MSDDPTPTSLTSPHFDTTLIDEHRRLLGPTAARRLVELFTTSLAERRSALHGALDVGDADAVRKAGHAVKGLAASSGASLLDEAAIKAVQGWTFVPARRGDSPIPHPVEVPIRFQLKN